MSRQPHFSFIEGIHKVPCTVSAKAFDPDDIHTEMWTCSWDFSTTLCIYLPSWSPAPDKLRVLPSLFLTLTVLSVYPGAKTQHHVHSFLSTASSWVNPDQILSVFFCIISSSYALPFCYFLSSLIHSLVYSYLLTFSENPYRACDLQGNIATEMWR